MSYKYNIDSNFTEISEVEFGKTYMFRVGKTTTETPYMSVSGVTWTSWTDQHKIKSANQEDTLTISGASGTVQHVAEDISTFIHQYPSGNIVANITGMEIADNHQKNINFVLEQGATAYMVTGVQITGSAQTIYWKNNTVPTGNISGVDVISLNIVKQTGSNYLIFSN